LETLCNMPSGPQAPVFTRSRALPHRYVLRTRRPSIRGAVQILVKLDPQSHHEWLSGVALSSDRFKAYRVPFHIYIVDVLAGHPPLEECEEQTIDNEDRGVDRTYEWTQAHGSLNSRPQRIWGRFKYSTIDGLSTFCHPCPVIKPANSVVRPMWIMFPLCNVCDCF